MVRFVSIDATRVSRIFKIDYRDYAKEKAPLTYPDRVKGKETRATRTEIMPWRKRRGLTLRESQASRLE